MTTGARTMQDYHILVVEDDYMTAEEIAEVLSNAGAHVLGPVPSLDDALRLVAAERRIDGAVLDVYVRQEAVWPVVDVLLARSVPVVFATSYDTSVIPHAYAHLPFCQKPTSGRDLARALLPQPST